MSTWFTGPKSAQERFYRQPPDPDPVLVDAARGRAHVNPATGRVLFRQSVMPIGFHIGKIMERVPESYYRIIGQQPWLRGHHGWGPVWDYIEREHPDLCAKPDPKLLKPPGTVYVDPPFTAESREPQARRVGNRHQHQWSHMWSDDVEALHKMARRIGLRREWFQSKPRGSGTPAFPHYDVVPTIRAMAIKYGAVEKPLKEWLQEQRAKDKAPPPA